MNPSGRDLLQASQKDLRLNFGLSVHLARTIHSQLHDGAQSQVGRGAGAGLAWPGSNSNRLRLTAAAHDNVVRNETLRDTQPPAPG